MNALRLRTGIYASLIALATILGTAAPVAAECPGFDSWPSFRVSAQSAQSIVVGEVVQGYRFDSTDRAVTFKFRVVHTIRGRSGPIIEFRDAVQFSPPPTFCPSNSILRVKVGDVIAFAFDARVADAAAPVLAVGYVRGDPSAVLMPEMERLPLGEIRRLVALPETDTLTSRPVSDQGIPALPLAAVAAFGAYVNLRRTSRSET